MYDHYDRSDQPHLQGLASPIDNVCSFPLSFRSDSEAEPYLHNASNAEPQELGQQLDPLGERILSAAKSLLLEANKITIKDLADATGLGDAVLRRRMNQIVDLNLLGCIPGSGRAPSHYYLLTECSNSETSETDATTFSDEQVLEKIKEKESSLLQELDSLQQDREALERAIAVRLKYSDK
jgi:hypothetical protein